MAGIDEVIRKSLGVTWKDVREELKTTPLALWNESVFRFHFVRGLLGRYPQADCQIEWHRVDLLVQAGGQNALVEFKFYTHLETKNLAGTLSHVKGGPSRKNFGEFCDCLKKLATIDCSKWMQKEEGAIHGRYLVLVYVERKEKKGVGCYSYWYDDIRRAKEAAEEVQLKSITSRPLITCLHSGERLICKAFAVHSGE